MAVLECIMVMWIAFRPGDAGVISEPGGITAWDITQDTETSRVCADCTVAMELVSDMTSTPGTQDVIDEALHELCQGLPEPNKTQCESQLKMNLPQVLQSLTSLGPSKSCVFLGLCAVQTERAASLQSTDFVFDKAVSSAVLDNNANPEVQVSPTCTFCVYLVKKLENLLPKNRTEEAVVKLMGEICSLLPASYKDQCDDFIDKYGEQLADFLLSSIAPHSICALLHLCLFEETPGLEPSLGSPELSHQVSRCHSCRALLILSRLYVGLNATEHQTSSFLQSVCVQHPYALPQCELFTRLYGFRLQKVLGDKMDALDQCQKVGLCAAVGARAAVGAERCAEPHHRCRDLRTAQDCGSVTFCQKFMWS